MTDKFDWQPKSNNTESATTQDRFQESKKSEQPTMKQYEEIKLSEMQQKVFIDRYALRGPDNELLENNVEEMWGRISKVISAVEDTSEQRKEWEHKFYDILHDFNFIPAGRILKGAGSNASLTFYNCFVIPSPEDSRSGIMDSVKTMMEALSRGGGVGVNLSTLRPRGAYVKGVNGTASGAVSFGGLYSYTTGLIMQGGSRRGALMLMLNDDHPDIEEFITAKKEMGQITNANLSVCVSDRFMEAVENDEDWDLKYQEKVYKTLPARKLWNMICDSAWDSGEPGVVFMERYNKTSNTWYFEDIICVNPCGEQGLPAWGVCNLGSINLFKMVNDNGTINYDRLKEVINASIRFMDNVIDTTEYHFEENKQRQRIVRRTGLGTLGLADLLIKMKIPYGSKEAQRVTHELYAFIRDEAYKASVEIAREKGPFPRFVKDKYLQGEFIKQLPEDIQKEIARHGIRNGVILTQAPTGTTSLLAGTSSGIEPVYDFAFKRNDRIGEHYIYHHLYEEYIKQYGDDEKPHYFVSAKELTPDEHVEMQAIIQQYTDSSISKTVNAPNEHTKEDVRDLYQKAYKLGCKGIAYFRDGSRDEAVLESIDRGEGKKKTEEAPEQKIEAQAQPAVIATEAQKTLPVMVEKVTGQRPNTPRPRPEVIQGATYQVKTKVGDMFVTVNSDQEGMFEILAQLNKTTDPLNDYTQVLARLTSLALQYGIDTEEIQKAITGTGGTLTSYLKERANPSCPEAIAEVMGRHSDEHEPEKEVYAETSVGAAVPVTAPLHLTTQSIKKKTLNDALQGVKDLVKPKVSTRPKCPKCSTELEMAEGCMKCHGCGYGLCGT